MLFCQWLNYKKANAKSIGGIRRRNFQFTVNPAISPMLCYRAFFTLLSVANILRCQYQHHLGLEWQNVCRPTVRCECQFLFQRLSFPTLGKYYPRHLLQWSDKHLDFGKVVEK